MGQTCPVTIRDSAMISLELRSDPEAISLIWSRQRSHPLLIYSFSSQSSVESLLMLISMILITKIYLNLQKLPGLGRGKACNLVPKPGLTALAVCLHRKASNPHHGPSCKQCWLFHQIRAKCKSSGFLFILPESFVLWQVPDHCCLLWVSIYPEHKRFMVGPVTKQTLHKNWDQVKNPKPAAELTAMKAAASPAGPHGAACPWSLQPVSRGIPSPSAPHWAQAQRGTLQGTHAPLCPVEASVILMTCWHIVGTYF